VTTRHDGRAVMAPPAPAGPMAEDAHRHSARIEALNGIMRLAISSQPLDAVLVAFGEGAAALLAFDGIGVSMIDSARDELTAIDVPARSLGLGVRRDERLPLRATLAAEVAARRVPRRVDDLAAPTVPARSRAIFQTRGYRSALLVPLVVRDAVAAVVTLASRHPGAFDDADLEIATELSQPLAAAIEQRRLVEEERRHAEELAALFTTSRLITARLELPAVLEAISRAVTGLIGSTGCGIALLSEDGTHLEHVAAHGARTEEWRRLSLAVGEGIIGSCAALNQAIRVDDVRLDPRAVPADVDEREAVRSMLCVPLGAGGHLIGVVSAVSTEPAVFTVHHQRVLEAFAEQAGIAIHNARLFEQSVRRAREMRALVEAGRAVTASLDVGETIRVIMEEARSVLGVASCGIMGIDEASGDLVLVASLDLPASAVSQIRVPVGEGIAGRAVRERRPLQSADLWDDPRVRFAQFPRASGFRSMLTAPLGVGDRAIGTISVFRRDVHRFSPDEEQILVALADQAAIALEHARLYGRLEDMVVARTRELDAQKRFVEVVLEALPLGVFVLDAGLAVVRVNREGARALGGAAGPGVAITALVPPERGEGLAVFLRQALAERRLCTVEEELAVGGETRVFRLTAAPVEPDGVHLVLLVDDITLAKRLERQMLLTERLTTAGRLAAGVAHELNNPLATIAGCAEALRGRLREPALSDLPGLEDFRHYLGLIEEEAYRCKDITGSLLGFVRDAGSRRAPTDLNALVVKTAELLSTQSRFGGRRFVTDLDPGLPAVTANEGQMRQVFLGLAANALEAMGSEGTLTIRSRSGRGEVEVEFADEGPGIPEDILGRIFDPFFTTKPPGQGTGLGLAIAQSIVTDHQGRIEVVSRPGAGSTFRVVLPA
jgi:signal transduction histidine kinase